MTYIKFVLNMLKTVISSYLSVFGLKIEIDRTPPPPTPPFKSVQNVQNYFIAFLSVSWHLGELFCCWWGQTKCENVLGKILNCFSKLCETFFNCSHKGHVISWEIPQRAFLGALDLLYLGVTIENSAPGGGTTGPPGHHYQYSFSKAVSHNFSFAQFLKSKILPKSF